MASSWSIEFERGIRADSFSLGIALSLIVIYLAITLGRRDPVDCMVGLSFCAVFSVGMALAASYGLASAFGQLFSPLHGIIPFLLTGLGVDDAFILVTNFQSAMANEKTMEDAVEKAMRVGGMSIMITSLTDFLAFAIGGATTSIPALSSFCIYAGLGVLFDFIFQITFFMGCLVVNARRSEANRRDVFICCKKQDDSFRTNRTPARGVCCLKCEWIKKDIAHPAFEQYAKILLKPLSKMLVMLIFLLLIGLSSFGVNQIRLNFRADWFLPPDSYLLDTIEIANDFFEVSTIFSVYTKDIDYYNRQSELNAIGTFLNTSSEIIPGTTDWWFGAFVVWASQTYPYNVTYNATENSVGRINGNQNSTQFYQSLTAFLESDGSRYANDILPVKRDEPAKGILAARSAAQIPASEFTGTGQQRFDAMQTLRGQLAEAMSYDDSRAFTRSFIFWERFGFILGELIRNLLIALAVMGFIVFFLIFNMPIVCSIIAAIGGTVLDVYGMAYYWGVEINFIVAIFLLIAIGLSVDYSAHVGHAFKDAHGTAEERSFIALKTTGPPVFNAIFSTFIAVLVLVNAQTYVFEIFFQMFTLTTLLGGFHGLVFLPVMLSFIGGDHYPEQSINTKRNETNIKGTQLRLTEIELMRRSGTNAFHQTEDGENKK
mmetsp:Transcript_17961/g.43972  ORF Transcript_17961/g.43972 Transcript_17961/m.43972 type:complete len:658 (+) Transcript_17961:1036-3009(+)